MRSILILLTFLTVSGCGGAGDRPAGSQTRKEEADLRGIWNNYFYKDRFGEETSEPYISNRIPIRGTFSNTATENSELVVRILITDSNNVAFQLYQYAGENPLKTSYPEYYQIYIRDAAGKDFEMRGVNSSDRIELRKTDSRRLHQILLLGGRIQVQIVNEERNTSHYQFTIANAAGYSVAYGQLGKDLH